MGRRLRDARIWTSIGGQCRGMHGVWDKIGRSEVLVQRYNFSWVALDMDMDMDMMNLRITACPRRYEVRPLDSFATTCLEGVRIQHCMPGLGTLTSVGTKRLAGRSLRCGSQR
jgi:hypothetical protein